MKKKRIYTVDAFTNQMFQGNPAAVVPFADDLTEQEMKQIAQEMNLSETAFLMKSEQAYFRIRYFSPEKEIDFCGHATIAASWLIKKLIRGLKGEITLETNVGVIPIIYKGNQVIMTQTTPQIKSVQESIPTIMNLVGLTEHDYDERYPIRYAYTGNWHLIIPVKTKVAIDDTHPDFDLLREHNLRNQVTSTHLFTLDIQEEGVLLYTRDFAPSAGVNEDPVTGSANGALAGYLALEKKVPMESNYKIIQGNSLNRMGEVYVVTKMVTNKLSVKIGGYAVLVLKGELTINE